LIGDTWIQILEINPTIYSENHLTTYAAGEGQVVIPIADIVIAITSKTDTLPPIVKVDDVTYKVQEL